MKIDGYYHGIKFAFYGNWTQKIEIEMKFHSKKRATMIIKWRNKCYIKKLKKVSNSPGGWA